MVTNDDIESRTGGRAEAPLKAEVVAASSTTDASASRGKSIGVQLVVQAWDEG